MNRKTFLYFSRARFPELQRPISTWTCPFAVPAGTRVPVDMPLFRNRRDPCPRGHACSRFPQAPVSLWTCPFPEPQRPMSPWTCLFAVPAGTRVPVDMPFSGTAETHVPVDMPVRGSRRHPCPCGHAPFRNRRDPCPRGHACSRFQQIHTSKGTCPSAGPEKATGTGANGGPSAK